MPSPTQDLIELIWRGAWALELFTSITGDPEVSPDVRTRSDIAKISLSTRWRQSTSL